MHAPLPNTGFRYAHMTHIADSEKILWAMRRHIFRKTPAMFARNKK
jgi:hypothetical protein